MVAEATLLNFPVSNHASPPKGHDCFEELIESQLKDSGFTGSQLRTLQKQIIHAATERLVFLVSPKAETIGFEIRSLQEFMAAWALMTGNEIEVKKRLREIAPISAWRNVFLFAVGKCFKDRNDSLLNEISKICTDFNDPTQNGLLLALRLGSQLALEILEEGTILKKPKYAKQFIEIALRLLDIPETLENESSRFAERLTLLYQPNLEQEFRSVIEPRISQRISSECLGAWACLSVLVRKEILWAKELEARYWPTNLLEQLAILRVCPLMEQDVWMINKMVDLLPRLSPMDLVNELSESSLRKVNLYNHLQSHSLNNHLGWLRKVQKLINHSKNLYEDQDALIFLKSTTLPPNIKIRCHYWLPNLEYDSLEKMPQSSFEWIPLIEADRFASNPSPTLLAKALRNIAQNYDHFSGRLLTWAQRKSTWVMGLCLLAGNNAQDLQEIADYAENGDLGNEVDWKQAEQSFVNDGVNIEQFRLELTIEELATTFKAKNYLQPPTFHFGLQFSPDRAQMSNSIALYFQIQEPQVKKFFASLMLLVWKLSNNIDPERKVFQPSLTPVQLQSFLEDASSETPIFPVNILRFLENAQNLSNEWLDVIDIYARKLRLQVTIGNSTKKLAEPFSQAFCAHPTRLGLLKVLEMYAIDGYKPDISPSLLEPSRFDDPKYREAALILRLAQDFQVSEAPLLAKGISELIEERKSIVTAVLATLSHHEINEATMHFLIELQRHLLPSKWHEAAKVTERLQKIQQSQQSQLDKPEVWQDLNFPTGLHQLLE